jgi:hypothetical protein
VLCEGKNYSPAKEVFQFSGDWIEIKLKMKCY